MKKKFSLRWQLLGILLVFICLVLGITYEIQTKTLNSFYLNQKIKTLADTADTISTHLEAGDLSNTLDKMTLSNEVCVRIVSSNANLVGFTENNACALKRVDDTLIAQWNSEVEASGGSLLFDNYKYRVTPDEVFDIFVYGKITTIEDDPVLILVSTNITPLTATINTLKAQYILIAAVLIVATILLAVFLYRLIVKPVHSIQNEVRNLPSGHYEKNRVSAYNQEFENLNDSLCEANEQIVQADKAKRDLIANVSHDLRTPLTMIVGYGEMIRDIPEENNEENINVIVDEAKRLNGLVNDLLDLSKYQAGSMTIVKEKCSLNGILKETYQQYQKYCEINHIDLKLEIGEDVEIDIDHKRISQVLYNFLNNAINYNDKEEKKLILGSEVSKDKVRVYVWDNGRGISEKDRERIWDRYYKVDKTHARASLGSGIGLSLCKEILQFHGLTYGVESVEGEYSRFYFDVKIEKS